MAGSKSLQRLAEFSADDSQSPRVVFKRAIQPETRREMKDLKKATKDEKLEVVTGGQIPGPHAGM